jgi:hypothetical protein
MDFAELGNLYGLMAAIDNRKPSPEAIAAWHEIIGHLSYDVAREALVLARRDESIGWLEPRHIIAKAKLVEAAIAKTIERCDRWGVPYSDPANGVYPKLTAENRAILNAECDRRRDTRKAIGS